MDIPIIPTASAPKPRQDVRIKSVEILPFPDRFRVWAHITITPFLERPNLLLIVHNEDDRIVSELNIIETMHHDMEFTLHIRGLTDPAGVYTLTTDLFYETRNPPHDRHIESFLIPTAEEAGN